MLYIMKLEVLTQWLMKTVGLPRKTLVKLKYTGPITRNRAKTQTQISLSKANRLMDDLFNEGKPSAVHIIHSQ